MYHSLLSTNAPDFDLDRDIIEPETILGIEAGSMAVREKKFKVNISTILISALLFLMILAWFDFMQTTFFSWLSPDTQFDVASNIKFWYAILITVFILSLVILIYYYSSDYMF